MRRNGMHCPKRPRWPMGAPCRSASTRPDPGRAMLPGTVRCCSPAPRAVPSSAFGFGGGGEHPEAGFRSPWEVREWRAALGARPEGREESPCWKSGEDGRDSACEGMRWAAPTGLGGPMGAPRRSTSTHAEKCASTPIHAGPRRLLLPHAALQCPVLLSGAPCCTDFRCRICGLGGAPGGGIWTAAGGARREARGARREARGARRERGGRSACARFLVRMGGRVHAKECAALPQAAPGAPASRWEPLADQRRLTRIHANPRRPAPLTAA
jgi:hypothetical protein